MSNRLIEETSPYLRQHAENPVDWYPWGDEAFERAAREQKPVFLSVGYSACHWCHVMEHESFEDADTAQVLNERFVSVKVDREERPDVDAIYMDAVQAMAGHGGWPMSVFLTPDGVPFYGGTYFPPVPRHGMPSFGDVARGVADLWERDRERVLQAGDELRESLQPHAVAAGPAGKLDNETLAAAMPRLYAPFDVAHGGWGGAPKFPQPAVAEFVLRRYVATGDDKLLGMALRTGEAMMRGGIYDHLGGGFHRYATDARWLVPHFEKMLYDNAQLARFYVHLWQVTSDPAFRIVATETLDYVLREMTHAFGGFYSAQDADTEGEEGRYFVWTPREVREALAEAGQAADAELVLAAYGVTERGNFEGRTVLHAAQLPDELAEVHGLTLADVETRLAHARHALLAARERRVRPGLDDKVLASWNGLMLAAFAEAGRVFDRDDYLEAAQRNATFVLTQMRAPDGRLYRTWRDGMAKLNGYLEDHAAMAEGLLELYQSDFDRRWFDAAVEFADIIGGHFADPAGGFFDTSDDHERLLLRPKELQDGAMPSGGAMAAALLARLAEYTGHERYADHARAALAPLQDTMARVPLGMAVWLSALDFMLAPPKMLAIVGPQPEPLLQVARQRLRPNLLVAASAYPAPDGPLVLENRTAIAGRATAYYCRRFACERPVNEASELAAMLAGDQFTGA